LTRQVLCFPLSQFQNRRNRKATAASSKSNDYLGPSDPTSGHASLTPPSQTRTGKKRKLEEVEEVDELDESENEVEDTRVHPYRRMRPSPNYSPSSSDSASISERSDAPSMVSSTDTLASWSRGMLAKDRNHSSESSTTGDTSSIYRDQGKTPTSVSFDEQVQRQFGKVTSTEQQREEDDSSAMLFDESGALQLDFDDLGLDLNSLIGDLPSFSNNAFDFSMPTPSSQYTDYPSNFEFDFQKTPQQSSFAVPSQPTSCEVAADRLNLSPISAAVEFMRAQRIDEWASVPDSVLREESDEEWFLDMEAFNLKGTSTPGSESASSSEAVSTPSDFFDFSLGSLSIDHILVGNLDTFREAQEKSVRPKELILDCDLANRCSLHGALTERVDTSQLSLLPSDE
jgi:hypothetical protein